MCSEGEVWFQGFQSVSVAPVEEDAGPEAGVRHGHDPKQRSQGDSLHTPGRELCQFAGQSVDHRFLK